MVQKQRMMLKASAIYKYLLAKSDSIEELIVLRAQEYELITTDQELYEGVACITDRSRIDVNRLVKLLEVVTIDSSEKTTGNKRTVLTPAQAQSIVKNAEEESDSKNN